MLRLISFFNSKESKLVPLDASSYNHDDHENELDAKAACYLPVMSMTVQFLADYRASTSTPISAVACSIEPA